MVLLWSFWPLLTPVAAAVEAEWVDLLQSKARQLTTILETSQPEPFVTVTARDVSLNAWGNETAPGVALELVSGPTAITMEAIKIKGGLIQSFSLNNRNILLQRPHMDQMDGSIFWPGPQSKWGWPPPKAIDPTPSKDFTTAYALEIDFMTRSFELRSPVWEEQNLSVSKKVSVDVSRMSFLIDYGIHVGGDTKIKWAPWEISRVQPYGLTFFRTGSEQTSGTWPSLDLKHRDGVTWFPQVGDKASGKLFASTVPSLPSSEMSWLAHTDGALLFVKCFHHIPNGTQAPGELQIEIYDGTDYVEIEQQGAYQEVFPGQPLTWRVEWLLRELPAGAKPIPGERLLVAAADELCS